MSLIEKQTRSYSTFIDQVQQKQVSLNLLKVALFVIGLMIHHLL